MSSVVARLAKNRAVADGLGTNKNPVKYLNQDFEQLRAQCLTSGTLFKDEEFPACPSALGYNELGPGSPKTQGVIWKRPEEICPNPQFIVDGATRGDIRQGALGDCWLLAAIASLTLDPDLVAQVVPENQSFQKDYAGIFHFRFWQYGEWVDVVVDDRLPTKNGKLVFVHSAEGDEFWSALLEKAYAKLNGSYEALTGGSTIEGFEDFTGGIAEVYELKKAPANLFQVIQKALKAESLLGCSIDITNAYDTEAITSRKLVKGHAYSVTGAEEVLYRGRQEKLIRVRNPWGEVEWTGPWSDEAPEWNYVDPKVKAVLDKRSEDGEFWMAFSDFLREYSRLEICNLSPDTLTSTDQHKWNITLYTGSWARGSTAGGCQNYPATFWTNPQFRIKLDEPDDDHQGPNIEPCCTVIVGLMQKNRRRKKKMGEDLLSIGYSLFKIPDQFQDHTDAHLGRDFFQKTPTAARSDTYINIREVSNRFHLPVGDYLIVPSTFEPFKNGDFCLRVFSEKEAKSLEVGDVVIAKPYEPQITNKDVTDEFKNIFDKLAGDKEEIDARELQTILNTLISKRPDLRSNGFTLNTCREMISLQDMDGTATLSLVEFRILWMKIQKYLTIYLKADSDRSGTMDSHELRSALQEAGFTLNNKIQQSIVQRYASNDLAVNFDGFISCMMRLETLFKMFEMLDKSKRGVVELSLQEWLCATLV
ncbi:calpain-8 isoform X1 [Xenopus laevis]|uniref:Calpain-8 isoform X1 n=1 Tax=Xenopus laevis TaxID=8355 RepID=A0A8J1KS94_XENLA|nr:calpain-8 isoform X1 [Xenopus laevis]